MSSRKIPARQALLVVAPDPSDGATIRDALAAGRRDAFDVECVKTLSAGLDRLRKGPVQAVIIDLHLRGGRGLDALERLLLAAPDVPVLILSTARHEHLTKKAIRRGAHDYLLKTHLDTYSLSRALHQMMERRVAEKTRWLDNERAGVTLDSIGDGVLSTDLAGNVTYLNAVAEGLTGWTNAEASGQPFRQVFHVVDAGTRKPAADPIEKAVAQNRAVSLSSNCLLLRRDGLEAAIEDSVAPIHDGRGRTIGAVVVFRDVSAARAMASQMAHHAHHDLLTDLPNRLLLSDRLARAIASARRHSRRLAVLFLDVDRFKHVNDSLGHTVGDRLLRSIAERVEASVRRSDTVSRQGGDEFVILLSEVGEPADAAVSAKKILSAIGGWHRIADHEVQITASIGISLYPLDGDEPEALIRSADTAMYHAKKLGRNRFQFFKHAMNSQAVERQSLEGHLQGALARQEFVLHYQPKLNLETGTIVGAEALIRWQHPARGLLPPSHFVPVAQDCGLIAPIGEWVLREACRQARGWQDLGFGPLPVSVNISAAEFRSRALLKNLRAILEETQLEPGCLELELTEHVLMEHADIAVSILRALKAQGIQLAVDDFGTGYSSLSHLRQFPIDALKVDRSFIREIGTGRKGAPVVRAVIGMGRSLNHRIVAEGVETREQVAFLRAERCGEAQGNYFSRPVVADRFAELVASGLPAKDA